MTDQLEQARLMRCRHDWPVYHLKHLARLTGGGTPAKENGAFWEGGDVPWISPKDMKRRVITSAEDYITEDAVDGGATSFVDAGSPLMVVRSGILRHTLPVAIAGRRLTLNQDMKAFNLSSRLNPMFFVYWVEGQSSDLLLEWRQFGATVESIDTGRLLNGRVALPDLPTQKAIADFLDRETARIDQLIEKNRRFGSLANERWVSELNDSVFPTFPNWSHLPAEWEKVRLKYLTDPMRPIMYGIVLPGPNVEFGKLIVKGGDVKPGRLDPELLYKTTIEIESTYVRSRVKAGDLIISIRGGIGDLEVVPKTIEGANLTQDAARIAPRSGIDVEWLRYALSAPVVFHLLEAKSLGAAVRGINIFDLKRVFVPTPPSEIQTRIRDSLVAAERRLARLKELVVQHTEKIQEFRSALITAAVTGQIDVSTWSKKGMTERRFDQIEEATSA